MICEIIAVGTELLLGATANTDAQVISQGLSEYGITVYYHTVCGDNPARLTSAIDIAKCRADIIITTGGLGPTADDLTKETIAAAFGKKLYEDADEMKKLVDRMGDNMTPNNRKQAWLPEGCEVLVNSWGTAPGCAFYAQGKHVLMLPGPPRECTAMFRERALPYLSRLTGGVIHSDYIKVFGMGESAMEDFLAPYIDTLTDVTAAPYAKEGECEVRITAMAETMEQAVDKCRPVTEKIKEMLGEVVYGVNVPNLEHVVVTGLTEKGLKLATAESCTGGLLAKRITDIPGSSACFEAGYITYADNIKEKILGVGHDTLAAHGAVSEETALAMARNVREKTGADIGIGITGIAGPGGGTEEKPVGLVYIGISAKDNEYVTRPNMRYARNRSRVRDYSASWALNSIRKDLNL